MSTVPDGRIKIDPATGYLCIDQDGYLMMCCEEVPGEPIECDDSDFANATLDILFNVTSRDIVSWGPPPNQAGPYDVSWSAQPYSTPLDANGLWTTGQFDYVPISGTEVTEDFLTSIPPASYTQMWGLKSVRISCVDLTTIEMSFAVARVTSDFYETAAGPPAHPWPLIESPPYSINFKVRFVRSGDSWTVTDQDYFSGTTATMLTPWSIDVNLT